MATEVQLVIFKLAKEDYGLPISKAQEINRMVAFTPRLPRLPAGHVNVSGVAMREIQVAGLVRQTGRRLHAESMSQLQSDDSTDDQQH